MATESCRLCGGETRFRRRFTVLGRFPATHLTCLDCGSLQCASPDWLDHAYGDGALASLDLGAVTRCLENRDVVLLLTRVLNIRTVLDYGGNDGLFCRMLRDRGVDARYMDPFGKPTYGAGFVGELTSGLGLVTAFEVLEHLVEPGRDLHSILSRDPNFILFSTELYADQGEDWWYFLPQTGQHIFFYTAKALDLLCTKYSYHRYQLFNRHLLSKTEITRSKLMLLETLSRPWPFRLWRAFVGATTSNRYLSRDFAAALSQATGAGT